MLCKNILYFAFVAFYCVCNKIKKERNLEACSERTKICGNLTVPGLFRQNIVAVKRPCNLSISPHKAYPLETFTLLNKR